MPILSVFYYLSIFVVYFAFVSINFSLEKDLNNFKCVQIVTGFEDMADFLANIDKNLMSVGIDCPI